jgi:hypothetical protein
MGIPPQALTFEFVKTGQFHGMAGVHGGGRLAAVSSDRSTAQTRCSPGEPLMTRFATAFTAADHHDLAAAPRADAQTDYSPARIAARVAIAVVLGGVFWTFIAPLTWPWIAAASTGAIIVVGSAILANR